ncbi:MAG TPA: GGDEF domain-containing protein [Gallionella sp.]|nr:GGDEF domain-containing protein [Gallionella sp.]
MTTSESKQEADHGHIFTAGKFHLLRRLSIPTLAAILVTAFVLIFIYQQDEIAEHRKIATQENEALAFRLMHLLDKPIYTFAAGSADLDPGALRDNPAIDTFTAELEKVLEPNIIKVKLYNLGGTIIYSSVGEEIGGTSKHPDWLQNALGNQVESHTEFRSSFSGIGGVMHDVNVSVIYIPLTHAGKRIGVFEVYADASPIFDRIHSSNIRIALIVFGAFTVLYAALFLSAHRADRAVSEWQSHLSELNDKVHKMAFYDALTQLPNRHLLKDRLTQTISACKRNGRYGALMFLDLDNFKPLNDEHGHGAGDLLLIEAARRIAGCVREADTVARFGGDEFVVVLSEVGANKAESTVRAGIVANKIHTALAEPYTLKVRQPCGAETAIEHRCTSSIGVAVFQNHEGSLDDLLKRADTAMYSAKESGRNAVRFFEGQAT